jgi:hypothetical protein
MTTGRINQVTILGDGEEFVPEESAPGRLAAQRATGVVEWWGAVAKAATPASDLPWA